MFVIFSSRVCKLKNPERYGSNEKVGVEIRQGLKETLSLWDKYAVLPAVILCGSLVIRSSVEKSKPIWQKMYIINFNVHRAAHEWLEKNFWKSTQHHCLCPILTPFPSPITATFLSVTQSWLSRWMLLLQWTLQKLERSWDNPDMNASILPASGSTWAKSNEEIKMGGLTTMAPAV